MGLYEVWNPTSDVFIERDNEVVKKLQQGAPELGWDGDPNMDVAYNKKTDRMELWRNCEDGQWRLLAESPPGTRVLDAGFVAWVASHNPKKGYNGFEEILKNNARLDAEKAQREQEAIHETADRIAFEFRKRL